MKHVLWLVAGTTEGRKLATALAAFPDMEIYVSVATAYGAALLPQLPQVKILQQRMDAGAMRKFLQEQKPELVLDATHPYATVVTQTLQQACRKEQVEYQRIVRPQGQYAHCIMVDSFAEAVEVLSQTTGTIFLTTGSKNLPDFTHLPDFSKRVVVRILPMPESLEKALDLGYERSRIICMQGPFSEEVNTAMFAQFETRYVVTKDSGATGGFPEKEAAALKTGAKLVVIARSPEQGSSYQGTVKIDRYGRRVPQHAHGSCNLGSFSSSSKLLVQAAADLYERITDSNLLVRRLTLAANHVLPAQAAAKKQEQELSLFDFGNEAVQQAAGQRENRLQQAQLEIKRRFGKNAVLKGMSLLDGATAKERNEQIGGHKA